MVGLITDINELAFDVGANFYVLAHFAVHSSFAKETCVMISYLSYRSFCIEAAVPCTFSSAVETISSFSKGGERRLNMKFLV